MTQVIGIASGKGGVGKTTVSVNLAVAISKLGKRVMLFDADLGLANAQLALGCRTEFNFGHVISGEKTLKEIVFNGPEGVQLIPGASGIRELASLSSSETAGIISGFSELEEDLDFLIVDLGAGISDMVLTFLQACQHRFVVLKNEPSSIADAYGIIKVMLRDYKLDNIKLIPNGVRSHTEGKKLSDNIASVVEKFLDSQVTSLQPIREDSSVLQAIRASAPVVCHNPESPASQDFNELANAVVELEQLSEVTGNLQFFLEKMVNQNASKAMSM